MTLIGSLLSNFRVEKLSQLDRQLDITNTLNTIKMRISKDNGNKSIKYKEIILSSYFPGDEFGGGGGGGGGEGGGDGPAPGPGPGDKGPSGPNTPSGPKRHFGTVDSSNVISHKIMG